MGNGHGIYCGDEVPSTAGHVCHLNDSAASSWNMRRDGSSAVTRGFCSIRTLLSVLRLVQGTAMIIKTNPHVLHSAKRVVTGFHVKSISRLNKKSL